MRPDPRDLFEIVATPDLGGPPVLVHAFDGFVDAGRVVELARDHLVSTSGGEVIARFDIDQLYDYRARRPLMHFERDHWESIAAPELVVRVLRDVEDTPYLLLSGPEPDVQWERFIEAVRLLIVELGGVRLAVGLTAFPMGVPHTRPTPVVVHASDPELLVGYTPWLGSVLVPGAMTNLLEFRLGQSGQQALGLACTVPPYLVQTSFPTGSAALLRELASRTGLLLPLATLDEAAALARAEVDTQVAGSVEVQAVVRSLEEAYDAAAAERLSGLDAHGPLPSADELGAELERFLAEQSGGDGSR